MSWVARSVSKCVNPTPIALSQKTGRRNLKEGRFMPTAGSGWLLPLDGADRRGTIGHNQTFRLDLQLTAL